MKTAISLTEGYTGGDLTPIAQANLNAAVAQGRPLEIPQGRHVLRATLVANLGAGSTGLTIYGAGKTQSTLVWPADASGTGLNLRSDNDNASIVLHDFGLRTAKRNVDTAIYINFDAQVVPNNGNPVIVDRFMPRGEVRNVLIRGDNGNAGFTNGIFVSSPLAFHVIGCDIYGVPVGSGTSWVSSTAIYLGRDQGYGHPVECYVQNNRVFHFQTAMLGQGMEGLFVQNSNFVGVGVGIWFLDNYGRPHLNAVDNHINCSECGIRVDNCSQFHIRGNLIYRVQDVPAGAINGVNIRGSLSTHGQIVDNCFENTDPSASKTLNSIVIEGARDISIDGNSYRRNTPAQINGVWLTSPTRKVVVGDTERPEQANGPFGGVGYAFLNQGDGSNVQRAA